MTRLFITTEIFDKMWEKLGLNDVDLLEVEKILIKNPKAGAVIPECQGVRKLRITLPGLHFPA